MSENRDLNKRKRLLYFVNVGWYFNLHWLKRAEAASNSGLEVHVLGNMESHITRDIMVSLGFHCHHLPIKRTTMNPFVEIRSFLFAWTLIRGIHPDLIHCITVKPNLLGGIIARFLGIRTVLSVPGVGLVFKASSLTRSLLQVVIKALYRVAANRSDCLLIFENQDDMELFRAFRIGSDTSRIVIHGAGVDTEHFSYCVEKQHSEPRILFASRMLWDKGIKDLIEATHLLRLAGMKFRLVVAGIIDTDNRNAIPEELVLSWHDQGLIDWLGNVNDMATLISDSSIVVLPTTYGEGVPRILIEAASVGRAIVATDVPGCREIVVSGYTGLLVKPNDVVGLSEAIATLLVDHQKRSAMGLQGRKLVEELFSDEIVIQRTMNVYRVLNVCMSTDCADA
jgi:glycosyltransferase involved in cell wall biosynthesis